MANREALRELQSRLAERLQAARTEARAVSWLAVECAGAGLLAVQSNLRILAINSSACTGLTT